MADHSDGKTIFPLIERLEVDEVMKATLRLGEKRVGQQLVKAPSTEGKPKANFLKTLLSAKRQGSGERDRDQQTVAH